MSDVLCECGYGLSDDGHDGNKIVRDPISRIGMYYDGGKFNVGNWGRPQGPVYCWKCKSAYWLPNLTKEVSL